MLFATNCHEVIALKTLFFIIIMPVLWFYRLRATMQIALMWLPCLRKCVAFLILFYEHGYSLTF